MRLLAIPKGFFDFGGENEIAFGESIDLVGPDGDFDFAVGQKDVGMMVLFVGDPGDGVGEFNAGHVAVEAVLFFEVVFVDHVPFAGKFFLQVVQLVAFEWRDTAFTGFAFFFSEFGRHGKLLGRNWLKHIE